MSMVAAVDLLIRAGDTFSRTFRYGAGPTQYRTISAIVKAAPARITANAHGLVDGWPVAITNVLGMVEINASAVPPKAPKARDYHRATVIDANTITLNDVNAAGYGTYKSGGVLQYATPVDLAGVSAELLIYLNGDTTLPALSYTSTGGDIVIDDVAKTIVLTLSDADTVVLAAAMSAGTYDLNLISGSVVTSLAGGVIRFDAGISAPPE